MASRLTQIRDRILLVCSPAEFDKVMEAIKNPVQHTYVIGILEKILMQINRLALSPNELSEIRTILEDIIVETRIICQDAKCDPFNYIFANRLENRS